MPENNEVVPTTEAQAASIAMLGEHVDDIPDPTLRAFVIRVMERVRELKEGEEEVAVMFSKGESNEAHV